MFRLVAGSLIMVALRKESVDRNAEDWLDAGSLSRSLSARRAWIEMPTRCWIPKTVTVALRKESVDRNIIDYVNDAINGWSLSARRAWIEIKYVVKDSDFSGVALRKESVDRNSKISKKVLTSTCRSPQGERG